MMALALAALGALIFFGGVVVGATVAGGAMLDRMERDRAIRTMQKIQDEMDFATDAAEGMAAFHASQQ